MDTSIVEKLRKLISHEQSAREIGSIAEADAFATKIQALLTEHKVSMSEVEAKEEEAIGVAHSSVVNPLEHPMMEREQRIAWLTLLAQTICKVNDCSLMVVPKYVPTKTGIRMAKTNKYIFIGVESDRLIAVEFYSYMAQLAWEMACKEAVKNKDRLRKELIAEKGANKTAYGNMSKKVHDFRHSFCEGFAVSVCARIMKSHNEVLQAAAAHEKALVLVDRRALMNREYVDNIRAKEEPRSVEHAKEVDASAYLQGRIMGTRVALTSKTVR